MQYPVQIAAENEISGIRALVYCFSEPAARIYTENVLVCGLKGTVKAEGTAADVEIRTGTLYFLPAGKEIRFCPAEGEPLALLIFIPDSVLADHPARITLNSSGEENSDAYIPILRLLVQLTELPAVADTYYEMHQKARWQQLLYELLSRFAMPGFSGAAGRQKKKESAERTPEAFREILDFIDLNYQEEIQLNELAKAFFYTPSHLSKQFSKYTGMKFTEYLTGLRLTKAMPLLLRSSMEIREISDRCGFPNERAFQQAFQKKYEVRPSVYRRNFAEEGASVGGEDMQEALKELHTAGIFSELRETISSAGNGSTGTYMPAQVPVIRRNAGTFDVSDTVHRSIAGKNNILHIDFCRDLLIDTIQEQVRMLQKNLHFEYINLNGFISDDLQIYYSDTINADFSEKKREDRVLRYDFTMYVKILAFVKQIGLKPIIPLSYIPSFLAKGADSFDSLYHSCIDMPYNMSEWEHYLFLLLNTLRTELGDWVESGRIFLWNVPDVHIVRTHRITAQEYFDLYRHTYRVIRKCLPGIAITSPTITCTPSGLEFCRNYLQFCRANDCLPEQLLFVYYHNIRSQFRYLSPVQEYSSFLGSVEDQLKSMKLAEQVRLCAFEYSMTFGRNPVCDALPSAMLPVTFTLGNSDRICGFGLYRGPELSTRTYAAGNMFTGIYSLLTKSGGRKAAFHALHFLNELGDECAAAEPGLYIARKKKSLQILLYYDVPQSEWKREFPADDPAAFYGDFPEMEVSLKLTHMEAAQKILIREQYINSGSGSAYEEWMAEGRKLEEQLSKYGYEYEMPKSQADGKPAVRTRIEPQEYTENGVPVYTFHCRLQPFEIRLVELVPVDTE